ncbi:MAG: hypothetical protein M3N45_14225, partial [Actinomycetota bacterium]|nr:hypothetical protein [Actinomycetota bacterium]
MSRKPTYSTDFEPDEAKIFAVREALISWYEENARDLPWRRTRDPWRVLLSEVMLQQIQVKRAIPFYESFLARFPTPRALADAPLAEAIRVWGDLGRYKRVVNLHRTARILVEEFSAEVPSNPGELVKLPGIGPYTAGAVACFAFDKDTAFVDTNARRVLHRLFFGANVPEPFATERAPAPRGGASALRAGLEVGPVRNRVRSYSMHGSQAALRVLPPERPLRREARDLG